VRADTRGVRGFGRGLSPRRRGLITALIGLSMVSFYMCAATAYNGFKAIGLAANGRTTEAPGP
jgi:hypothetical protein